MIAKMLSPGSQRVTEPSEAPPNAIIQLMKDIGIPNGIGGVGYVKGDIADLVEGTMKQQRLLATAPLPVTEDDIARIFEHSIELW